MSVRPLGGLAVEKGSCNGAVGNEGVRLPLHEEPTDPLADHRADYVLD